MKKDKTHSAKKLWITVWVIVVSVMAVGIVSGAAYINRNSVKRVVSTQGSGGTAFSSNYMTLLLENDTFSVKSISISDNTAPSTLVITVCNYVQSDPSKVNQNNITYNMKFELVDKQNHPVKSGYGNAQVTCEGNTEDFVDGICEFAAHTLTGETKSVKTYVVTVPKELVEAEVRIKAAAVPSDNNSKAAVNNYFLGRIFTFVYAEETKMTWTGSFVEKTTDGYDGFNYIIKGQGKGTVTLKWDPSKLEINQTFWRMNGFTVVDADDNKKSLTMAVDSDKQGRYDIQFYQVENVDYSQFDINKDSGVEIEYTEAESS